MGVYKRAAICKRGHVFSGDLEYEDAVADRCSECGAEVLTTWAGRKERIRELQNALEEESDLDEATKLWVSEQLAPLQNLEFTDEKAQKRLWENLREHAPQLWKHERTQRIIDTLISAGVKSAIGGS
jgi:hypothetical protein